MKKEELTELTAKELETVNGGASYWYATPRPRRPQGNRPR
jgi:bacteriocin-like protein